MSKLIFQGPKNFVCEEETTGYDFSFNADYYNDQTTLVRPDTSQYKDESIKTGKFIKELDCQLRQMKMISHRLSELSDDKATSRAKLISRASTCDDLDEFLSRSPSPPDVVTNEKSSCSCMSGCNIF